MKLGQHKTRCGLRAIVAQMKLDGALCLQAWDIYGVSIIGPAFDLVDV
jgi:hypothetical protein